VSIIGNNPCSYQFPFHQESPFFPRKLPLNLALRCSYEQTSLERASNDISKAVVASSSSAQPNLSLAFPSEDEKSVLPKTRGTNQSLSPETAAEAIAAAALADVMLQLFPQVINLGMSYCSHSV
jgi:hypothetical protein